MHVQLHVLGHLKAEFQGFQPKLQLFKNDKKLGLNSELTPEEHAGANQGHGHRNSVQTGHRNSVQTGHRNSVQTGRRDSLQTRHRNSLQIDSLIQTSHVVLDSGNNNRTSFRQQ